MDEKISARSAYAASRRRFLRDATFVSLGIVAASCAPGATPGPQGGTTAKKGGEFHGTWPYDTPPKGEWNQFGANPILASYWGELAYANLAFYRWADKKWDYMLAESHTVAPTQIEVKLRKGIKWDDGTEVTAKDVAATYWIGRMLSYGIWNYAEDLETPDDQTIRFKMKKASALAERNVLRNGIRPASVYGTFADRAKDLFKAGKAVTSDEVKALRKELSDFKPKGPSSSGPYKVDPSSLTEAQLTMVRNGGGLFADKVNFDKIVIFHGDTEEITPLVLAGDIDYSTSFFPTATEKALEGQGFKIVRGPFYTGPALYFHWEAAPMFQDKRLRQAVAFALDRDEANHVAYGDKTQAPQWCAAVSDTILKSWLSPDDQRKLTVYKKDTAKAESLLKDAGYAKGADGTWAKDGKKLEFDLQYPSDFSDWSAVATNIADQLTKFGIKTTLRGAPRSTQSTDFNSGKFTLSFNAWGFSPNPHPQPSFARPIREFNTTPAGGGHKYPVKQGSVDFEALLIQAEDADEAKQKDAVKQLAAACNDMLPCIPLAERFNNAPINDQKRVTGWLPLEDKLYTNGGGDSFAYIQIVSGGLGAK